MSQLTIEQFTRIIVNLVDSLGNITLSNPGDTETFPCGVISNPMESIKLTENNTPIYKRFSITIDWWTNSKYTSMQLYEQANQLLRQNNILMSGGIIDLYDEVTKKYRYGATYEVNYNGLTNSFERIK